MSTPDRLLKIREAADRLGVDYGTIRGAIEQGLLVAVPHEGSYRIRPDALEAYREALSRPKLPKAEPEPPATPDSPELEDARSFSEQVKRWSKRSTGKPGPSGSFRPAED